MPASCSPRSAGPVTAAEIDAHLAVALRRAAVARHGGAARATATIDFDALVDFSARPLRATKGTLLIEGIGGVMVPLDDQHTVLDWMVALHMPGRAGHRQLSRQPQPHA